MRPRMQGNGFLRQLLGILLLLFMTAGKLHALDIPQLSGRVNDYASILSPVTIEQLENSLETFEREQSTQIVVLTIPSLQNESLEDFSIRVAEEWKIGQAGLDNGAILLVARQERKIRIEVGYGLEGSLTDLVSGRIIRNIIVPEFKKGNFDRGVVAGVSAMMDAARGEFSAADIPTKTTNTQPDFEGFMVMLFGLLFFIGKIFGRSRFLSGALGGILASSLTFFILGPKWLLIIILFPVGVIGGLIASNFAPPGYGRAKVAGAHQEVPGDQAVVVLAAVSAGEEVVLAVAVVDSVAVVPQEDGDINEKLIKNISHN